MRRLLGFTVVEITVTMGIFALVSIMVGSLSASIFRYNQILSSQLDVERTARQGANMFARELRTAIESSLGAYPIEQATQTSLIFYANVDSDVFVERIRYFLSGTTLQRGSLKPSGSPLSYNPLNEKVTTLVSGVRNADPLAYYDDTYTGTSAALVFPVTVSDVRLVTLRLVVDEDTAKAPTPMTVETAVTIRNLKGL